VVPSIGRIVLIAVMAELVAAVPAAAQIQLPIPTITPIPTALPTVVPGNPLQTGPGAQPYQANDGKGFRDVLPPGARGRYNVAELAAFLSTGATVPHCCDQLPMYRDLMYATPGLRAEDVSKYFKDSSFGVPDGQADRTYSPRDDVTIVRDKGFGVPHIYGRTRDGAMFGIGYVAAEDRLFFMDALRHAGRAELSDFAGGSNAAMDAEQWGVAPYTDADLDRQATRLPEFLGPTGQIIVRDVENYVAGINQYIAEARIDPTKMPGEYAAINRPQGPDLWKPSDLIATASLVGGIFGKGGGMELQWSQVADALQKRFGKRLGMRVFRNFRSAEDPGAPVTVFGKRFPYQKPPKLGRRARGVARPDAGTLRYHEIVAAHTGGTKARSTGIGLSRAALPFSSSNAVLISGAHSVSGHPLMVAGPQVAYFNPEILMEQDVHAPASGNLPGIDARGAAFPGVNLYVQLGHGRDYAWSATSAGQDNIDTFAVTLCEPGGGGATLDSMHYLYRGSCLPIEVLEKKNSWQPSPGDDTPAGTQTLRAERTKLGLLAGRGLVRGKPVAFVKLRSTYFHEVDSAAGFLDFNDPAKVHDPQSFQRAASRIGYTFNWFYADPEHIAYFNSGNNPVRAKGIDHNFPVRGRRAFEWRGWDPDRWIARFSRPSRHPQVIDQSYLVNWNNKQARGFRGPDENVFSSVYRSVLLSDRVKAALKGGAKLTLPQVIDIMETAGTEDLRAHSVLPLALRIIGRPKDPALRQAVSLLRAWRKSGGARIDRDNNGTYEHSDAIRIMDAWWPLWVRAEFQPVLHKAALDSLLATTAVDNPPNNHGDHLGSSYQGAWFGYVRKDLRTVLGRKVKGRYARKYCGRGRLKRCRSALRASLKAALGVPASELYKDDVCAKAGQDRDQKCFDSIRFRPVGGATQPLIPWVNRPTYQQANEIQSRVPR
jgi:acyl-homoserine lactone acylase PvdQ